MLTILHCHQLLILSLLFSGQVRATTADQNGPKSWEVVSQGAPFFAHAIADLTPHLRSWLESPDPPGAQFTLFAPVDEGCTLAEYAKGLSEAHIDALVRYHIVVGRTVVFAGQPDLLETGLEGMMGGGSGTTGGKHDVAPFCYLPQGHRQRLKTFRDDHGIDRLFDGELPEASVVQYVPTVDGAVVFIDRTLFPPLVTPSSIINTTPIKPLLESLLQFGMADYRTAPMTLLLPASLALSSALLKDPQLAGAHAVPGIIYSSDFREGFQLRTLTGARVTITDDGKDFHVNGARIVLYDVPTSFGVAHVIERPLIEVKDQILLDTTASSGNDGGHLPKRPEKSHAVRQPMAVWQQYSTGTALMVAGAVAVCMAIGYIVWRR